MRGINRRKKMANQEHLDLLKQSTPVWNKWRARHPNIQPDLYGANLSRANLSRATLRGATLYEPP
jgi:uncharacterized protein YjbI with pentapeptide repeats